MANSMYELGRRQGSIEHLYLSLEAIHLSAAMMHSGMVGAWCHACMHGGTSVDAQRNGVFRAMQVSPMHAFLKMPSVHACTVPRAAVQAILACVCVHRSAAMKLTMQQRALFLPDLSQ